MARTLLGGLEHATFNFFVFAARLLLVFISIHLSRCWNLHQSLAPRTRTLLGVLGQATLNFVAVTTLLFFFFCVCPKFCDLAKQRRKIFVGVSEVGKIDFAIYFLLVVCLFLGVLIFFSYSIIPAWVSSDAMIRTATRFFALFFSSSSTFLVLLIVMSGFRGENAIIHHLYPIHLLDQYAHDGGGNKHHV